MESNSSTPPRRLHKALNYFTKKPAQVFALAIGFVCLVLLTISVAIYFGYLANLEISQVFSTSISVAAILFSALWASTFVVQNMNSARETAKLHETLTLIRAAELDREFILARTVWSKYRSKSDYDERFAALMAAFLLDLKNDSPRRGTEVDIDDGLETRVHNQENDIRRDASLLLTYFNFFELSSLAIKQEIMDEGFFKEWYGTNFVRTWNISVHAIGAMRKLHTNPRLYIEWQTCAKRWAGQLDLTIKDPYDYHLKDLVQLAEKWHG
jgi:hypothetical protein